MKGDAVSRGSKHLPRTDGHHLGDTSTNERSEPATTAAVLNTFTLGDLDVIRKSIVQHSAAQYSLLQHSAAQYSLLQHCATQCSLLQHSAAHYSTVQHSLLQHSTVCYSTVQSVTAQCSTWSEVCLTSRGMTLTLHPSSFLAM